MGRGKGTETTRKHLLIEKKLNKKKRKKNYKEYVFRRLNFNVSNIIIK